MRAYGDARKFAETFNPDLQKRCASDIQRSIMGAAPTISRLLEAYREDQVQIWVLAQLENLNQFAGAKNKMSIVQMDMLTDIILSEYHYLKASELLLFFYQFKSGKYGGLYGSVDPLRITSALLEFVVYRRDMLTLFEREQQRQKMLEEAEEREQNAVTYDEWKELKRKKS